MNNSTVAWNIIGGPDEGLSTTVRGHSGKEFGFENVGTVCSKVNKDNTLVIHTLNESGTIDVVTRAKDDVYYPLP